MENKNNTAQLLGSFAILFIAIILVCGLTVYRKLDHGVLAWWEYLDILFIFLAAFCRLCAAIYGPRLQIIGRRFNLIALISLILGIVSFLVSWALLR